MKFSYQWLTELVPGLTAEPASLERLITMKTAECDGIEAVRKPFGTVEPDWIIEIDNKSLTHRPDLWGHYGMAREVAAITGCGLKDPVDPGVLPSRDAVLKVHIEDHNLCPRYSAILIENARVEDSPLWLQARLESVGLNTISNLVDVTNYVLAELPQPMHAFDADKLRGGTIFVRLARSGEVLRALNGETYELTSADLVIADAAGPVALAGVIGGADSAISESTTRIVFESANFQASRVRLSSSRHKLRTDASMRFEKSLDPQNTLRGLARAIQLLKELSPAATCVGGVADNFAGDAATPIITLPVDFVVRKLGARVSKQQITQILSALGFGVTEQSSEVFLVTVPTWRATKDISIKDDLVEEVGRMIGYEDISPVAPLVASVVPSPNPMRTYLRQLRFQLAGQGFTEVHNYSFVNEEEVKRFNQKIEDHIAVVNPIASEQTHLRKSLLPGLLHNIRDNVRHFPAFRIFEIGNEIHPARGLPRQTTHAAGVLYNARASVSDFFELKRTVEILLPGCAVKAAAAEAYEHPARTAEIEWHGISPGRLFELHPSLLQEEGIPGRAFVFDLDLHLTQPIAAAQVIRYQALRRFPTSGFDLSVIAGLRAPVAEIEAGLRRLGGANVVALAFVDQYSGPPLSDGEKSVSYHIEVGAPDRTLTAEQAGEIRAVIIEGMRSLGYELRV